MAIALDATSNGNATSTSITIAHTCTGADRILFVGVYYQGGDNFTSVTYNGVALTQIAKVNNGLAIWGALYYLVAPSTGTNNIVVTVSASAFLGAGGVSYTGAKQSGQPDASTTNTGSGTSLTTSVTTVADNSWAILQAQNANDTITASTGSTLRSDHSFGFGVVFDSNGAKTPAGSTSMTFNGSSGTQSAVMASFAPSVAITYQGNFFHVM